MEFRKTISLQERVAFVDAVLRMSEEDGRHKHAIFDYAFRIVAMTYFYPDLDVSGKTVEELNEIAYSEAYEELYREENGSLPRDLLNELYRACTNEIKDRRQEYMEAYTNIVHPDPLNKIADDIEKVTDAVGAIFNQKSVSAMMADIYKQERGKRGGNEKDKAAPMGSNAISFDEISQKE